MSPWKSFYCCSWSENICICVLIDLKTNIASVYNLNVGRDRAVGRATSYRLDGPGKDPNRGEIFRTLSERLGPTQPPIKWVLGLFTGDKAAGVRNLPSTPHVESRLKKE
jgi:hypothetical protein